MTTDMKFLADFYQMTDSSTCHRCHIGYGDMKVILSMYIPGKDTALQGADISDRELAQYMVPYMGADVIGFDLGAGFFVRDVVVTAAGRFV